MTTNTASTLSALSMAAAMAGLLPAHAATVNFETNPVLGTAPSIYVAVPGPQTFVTPEATFSGGVALGFATFFPAISFATIPNVYGTADFGNGLARSLDIAINPAFKTTEVSFVLFNGEVFNQSYIVNAFNGTTLVASQLLSNLATNFNSGYGFADVVSLSGITSVNIAPTNNPASWDFLIDTVLFNQSITNTPPPVVQPPVVQPPPVAPPSIQPPPPPVHGRRHGKDKGEVELVEVNFGDDVNDIRGSVLVMQAVPEPSTWAMLLTGFAGIGWVTRRRGARRL